MTGPAHDDGPDGETAGREWLVVGLLADPDLAEDVARDIAPRLQDELPGEVAGRAVGWTVVTGRDAFESLGSPDTDLIDKARERVADTGWDLAVCLTDVPLRSGGRTVVADVADDCVAVVSLPALGSLRLRDRARRAVGDAVTTMAAQHLDPGSGSTGTVPARRGGALRLLTGMVHVNRPWALTVGLTRSLAGGLAGAAFGVLYPSIWTLAASMPGWRLAVALAGAVMVHGGWLVVGHGLWERRGDPRRRDRPSTGLRNSATVVTVVLGVAAYTAVLFALALAALLVIVTPDYLGQEIGHRAGFGDYLATALMATVVGTVAGAIGSGLEDGAAVRRAAYRTRTAERIRDG
ncbi:MAG: hypothetical protein ACQEXM_02650 [Actinomycetota bacterium]